MARPLPTQERLKELFDYRDGALYWTGPGKGRQVDRAAGGQRQDGYWLIGLDSGKHYRHRLVWIWHNGEIPAGLVVDHKNSIKGDDRIENLQVISQRENVTKDKPRTGLPRSVRCRDKSYCVEFCFSSKGVRKRHYMGGFATVEEAVAARENFLSQVDYTCKNSDSPA